MVSNYIIINEIGLISVDNVICMTKTKESNDMKLESKKCNENWTILQWYIKSTENL